MIKLDRDALICDLAETYHVYSLEELPLHTVALLAAGLGENSRIKRKLNNNEYSLDTTLLAMAVDRLAYLFWGMCQSGKKQYKPKSVLDELHNANKHEENQVMKFSSPEAFKIARQMIIGGRKDG